jgi:outer membrane protein TolC
LIRSGQLSGIAGLRIRRIVAGIAAATISMAAVAVAHGQVSLATVVDLAQRNSTGVRAAQADVNKATAVLSESKDAVIPSVTLSTGLPVFPEVGFTGQPPTIWGATVESLVFGVPQKRYIDAGRMGLRAAGARLKDAREQVALDASTAYVELDAVNQELNAAHEQEQLATRLMDIEQQRAEAGVDAMSELLLARLSAAEIKLRRIHIEARAAVLGKQLAALTGLPDGSIRIDHASIPEIPQLHADSPEHDVPGVRAAYLTALSKGLQAKGDQEIKYLPQMNFVAQYNRNTTLLNNVNSYFAKPLPANNFSSGISVEIPIFNMGQRAKARESSAEALRSKVDAEQAEKQNDLAIAELSGSIRELDTQAEIAGLKQQIADEQLKTVLTQLELGNGAGSGPGSQPQVSPKAEQMARIDARQKTEDALDAGFELAKARLNLLRALGHMDDWLHELHGK